MILLCNVRIRRLENHTIKQRELLTFSSFLVNYKRNLTVLTFSVYVAEKRNFASHQRAFDQRGI